MASGTMPLAARFGLPQYKEGDEFDQWASEIEIWKDVTDVKPEK